MSEKGMSVLMGQGTDTHELGHESPAAVAGHVTGGYIRQQADADEGGEGEGGEEGGENDAFLCAEGQVKVAPRRPLPSVAVPTGDKRHLG